MANKNTTTRIAMHAFMMVRDTIDKGQRTIVYFTIFEITEKA